MLKYRETNFQLFQVSKGVEASLVQLLETGLLHGDPHPGNLRYISSGQIGYGFGLPCPWIDKTPRSVLAELYLIIISIIKFVASKSVFLLTHKHQVKIWQISFQQALNLLIFMALLPLPLISVAVSWILDYFARWKRSIGLLCLLP
jgi:predicted unusual protein kinase regulating ubiquinone biosynthesis (AarF/ABC1/UbiB family)